MPPTPAQSRRRMNSFGTHLASFLMGCCATSLLFSVLHANMLDSSHSDSMDTFAAKHILVKESPGSKAVQSTSVRNHLPARSTSSEQSLDCSSFGGPSAENVQEMVYWKDIPNDSRYVSPFYDPHGPKKYMTFEPDGGGWNNIRMSMETVVALAVATGRTLVLPPSQRMYLLGGNSFSFADFFPLHEIAAEHEGLEIITMTEFLTRTQNSLVSKETGKVTNPPGDRLDWDGHTSSVKEELNPYLRSIAANPEWDPMKCIAAFPASTDPKDEASLQKDFETVINSIKPQIEQFVNQPTPVDASTADRLAEFLANRDQLCMYNAELQGETVIHFAGKRSMAGGRLLVHFYAFLFFQDWKQDLWMRRFVRDHIRYIDEVQCAAGRIVAAVREYSKKKGKGGIYDSFHIRRGDFQYKKVKIPAAEIYKISKEHIPDGAVVYVGTDERDKEFFTDLKAHYDVLFLDDFANLISDINPNYFGMIDQLVTARGRTFYGCWFSTFTGYINRIRGYHSTNEKLDGYEMGLLNSYYYALPQNKDMMRDYWPIKKAFYAREFPASWRDLDHGVEISSL